MLKHDGTEIRRFLEWVGSPWHLCAIPNSGNGIRGIWTDDIDEAIRFATGWNGEPEYRNIYWTVNPLMRDPGPKPSESDVLEMRWIHVDVDPRAREDLDSEQARIRELLTTADPRPSAIIFSGGGYQAFWRLEEPVPISGREELYEQAKLYNKQMEICYDADSCHNTDRLMRLPGCINWPNKRKREKGRTPALASAVSTNDLVYPIGRFIKAAPVQQRGGLGGPARPIKLEANVKRLDTLDSIHDKVSSDCIRMISHGNDPDDPGRLGGDRSRALWYVVCEMVRGGVDDDTIFSIITDQEWGISAHVLDQPRPEDYAIRQIERAHEEAIAPELVELNDSFATTLAGGKFRVLRESRRPGDDYPTLDFMTKGDFKDYLSHRTVELTIDGKQKHVGLAEWWLRHERARRYEGVVFYPGKESTKFYNLWRGFAYQAKPGDCSLFLDHVKTNLCHGKQDWYEYLLGWMAHAVQCPDQPGHTAVVIQGKQGTGKGFFANHFGKLFGRHYLPVRDSEHIFGRFNGHLQDSVVVFADESFWVGGKKQASMMKALITEPEIVVERKGVDAVRSRNCVHLIMASNEDHVVARDDNDRRFFVLEVGDDKMQDSSYFGAIAKQMESGGYEALLYYLLNHDISEFDIRQMPQTRAGQEQQDHTRSGIAAWWYEKLLDGQMYSHRDGWPSIVFRDEMLLDLEEYLERYGERPYASHTNRVKMGLFLRKYLPNQTGDRLRGEHSVTVDRALPPQTKCNPKIYQTATVEECRKIWEDRRGRGAMDWPEGEIIDAEQAREEPF